MLVDLKDSEANKEVECLDERVGLCTEHKPRVLHLPGQLHQLLVPHASKVAGASLGETVDVHEEVHIRPEELEVED